jgi:hypothetical protein
MLKSWRSFVFLLLESLFEDIQRNEHFDEIATLTSKQDTIFLFKLKKDGNSRFSFAFNKALLELLPVKNQPFAGGGKYLDSFDTFKERLEKLLKINDLSLYEARFTDRSLKKNLFQYSARGIQYNESDC